MTLPLYLAMTGAEMNGSAHLPDRVAWMACHFCPYSTGLSNLPAALPQDPVIILNDRTPPSAHNPVLIAEQLQQLADQFRAAAVLLDFQRPGDDHTRQIVKAVTEELSCPVGVSAAYAKGVDCAVFLDPVPLHIPLNDHIAPWEGRPIWLDVALDCLQIRLFEDGCRFSPATVPADDAGFLDKKLHCHYRIANKADHALFTLWRTSDCIAALLEEAETLGIQKAFGLYQQLGKK